jgi:ATP-dependent RNA helicase UAP56/SUB2
VFLKTPQRCAALTQLLAEKRYQVIEFHRSMSQQNRLANYEQFKTNEKSVLVTTSSFARGIYFDKLNAVINYDMSDTADKYLHCVTRAGARGVAITFVSNKSESELKLLNEIRDRFKIELNELGQTELESLFPSSKKRDSCNKA